MKHIEISLSWKGWTHVIHKNPADSEDAADHQDLPPSPPVEAAVPQNQASAEETSKQQTYVDEQDLQRQFFDNLKKKHSAIYRYPQRLLWILIYN